MRKVHPAAQEALSAAIEHAQQTSRRVKRAQEREFVTMQLLSKSREDLRRTRERLAKLVLRPLSAADGPPPNKPTR